MRFGGGEPPLPTGGPVPSINHPVVDAPYSFEWWMLLLMAAFVLLLFLCWKALAPTVSEPEESYTGRHRIEDRYKVLKRRSKTGLRLAFVASSLMAFFFILFWALIR
jgi:hypothetical protein